MSLCLTKSWTWLEFVLFAKKYPVFLPLTRHVNVPGSCVKYLALSPPTQLDISLKISCLDASNRAEIVPTSCKIYPFFLTVTQLEMTWCLVENIWFGCFNLSKTITSFWMNSPSSALSTFRTLWSVAGLIITKAFFFFFYLCSPESGLIVWASGITRPPRGLHIPKQQSCTVKYLSVHSWLYSMFTV